MSDKQTRCPNCSTIYKVTVTQLTVAQGMVCCPKCCAEFNALLNLNRPKDETVQQPPLGRVFDHVPMVLEDHPTENHVLDIFDRKPQSSNINLKTYLNNLNTFNNDPLTQFPALNLSSGQHHADSKYSKKNSFVLCGLVSCQFNPSVSLNLSSAVVQSKSLRTPSVH